MSTPLVKGAACGGGPTGLGDRESFLSAETLGVRRLWTPVLLCLRSWGGLFSRLRQLHLPRLGLASWPALRIYHRDSHGLFAAWAA